MLTQTRVYINRMFTTTTTTTTTVFCTLETSESSYRGTVLELLALEQGALHPKLSLLGLAFTRIVYYYYYYYYYYSS